VDEGQLSIVFSALGSRLFKIADMPIIADGGKISRWLQAQQRRGNGTYEQGVVTYEPVTSRQMLIRSLEQHSRSKTHFSFSKVHA
jgi:hypothetical protein